MKNALNNGDLGLLRLMRTRGHHPAAGPGRLAGQRLLSPLGRGGAEGALGSATTAPAPAPVTAGAGALSTTTAGGGATGTSRVVAQDAR